MNTMINETLADFLSRFIKKMSISLRRQTTLSENFSSYALMICVSNAERRAWHSRSMHIFKMSMFNWKLWKETYVDSVLPHCQHINMINDSELKQQISSERSKAYLRRAKILIHKLVFKINKFCETRSLDEKNVFRLHNIFELKDCSRLNSDNYVSTLINRKMLTDALKKDESLNVSLSDCEELSLLKVKESLICLHERHRLAATTRYFFQSKQKWWIVNLYLNNIRTDLFSRNLVSLLILVSRFEFISDHCFERSVLELSKLLRWEYFLQLALLSTEKWRGWGRKVNGSIIRKQANRRRAVTEHDQENLWDDCIARRFECVTSLCELVIISVDRCFSSSANLALFRDDDSSYYVNASYKFLLKYEQKLSNCLAVVKTTWEQILKLTDTSYFHLDVNIVHIIQSQSLLTFSENYHFIENCMQNEILFSTVMNRQQRLDIFRRLSVISYLILSLYIFIEDTKHIESFIKIMKRLLLLWFKNFVRQAFERLYTSQTQIMKQRSETMFRLFSHSAKECFQVIYQQLWLFVMRRFFEMTDIQSRKNAERSMKIITSETEKWWHRFDELASKSEFDFAQIHHLCTQNSKKKIIRDFLHQTQSSDVYQFDETVFNSEIQRISRSLSNVQLRDIHRSAAEFYFNAQRSLKLSKRCDRLFYQSFLLNRKVLFREMIYNDDSKLVEIAEQRRRNINSLAIKRNIFRAFFDNLASVSRIETVMSSVNNKVDAFIVSVSHSLRNENLSWESTFESSSTTHRLSQFSARRNNFNEHQANLSHKYRLKESLSDIMLSSNLLHNFIQMNLQDQSMHVMLYDLNLTWFHCIEFTEINFNHFVLRHKECVYYCIDQIERLDTVDLKKLYNTILKSKNIVFFENFAQTRTGSRSRTMTNLNALKLEMTICETVNNRKSFLEELPSS